MPITPTNLPSLQASPDLRAEFLSAVSHELRTSLNNIDGMAELLLDSHLSPQQSAFAQEVKISGRVLQSHINDLLDFCRADLGKIELDNKDFELLSVVESTAEMFANEAREKHISIMTFVDPDIPIRLRGDAARLQRILLSMIASSVHAANCNEIVIRANLHSKDSKNCKVRWEISSTRDQTHHTSSGRLPSNPVPNYPTTEVGRMLCNLMVELMGGKVETTESLSNSALTKFTTVFAQSASARPQQPIEDTSAGGSKGLRVVVVDDSPANRLVISSYIRSWGMRHEASDSISNAHAALAALRRGASDGDPYDIAVIDLAMPEMDGVDLGHAIRQDPSLEGVSLIMLTASDDPAQAKRAMKAGFSAYLTKPVKQSHLLDSIFNVAYNKIGMQMGLNVTEEVTAPAPCLLYTS
nr:hybrid sensor histidine kinase/response regulator [Anaerolineae bacterium]